MIRIIMMLIELITLPLRILWALAEINNKK